MSSKQYRLKNCEYELIQLIRMMESGNMIRIRRILMEESIKELEDAQNCSRNLEKLYAYKEVLHSGEKPEKEDVVSEIDELLKKYAPIIHFRNPIKSFPKEEELEYAIDYFSDMMTDSTEEASLLSKLSTLIEKVNSKNKKIE